MRPGFSAAQAIGAGLAIANLPFVNALAPRTEIADSYDFVIVGGGQAGLVIGGRLSQSLKNHSILVLEAGENGDAYRKRIGELSIPLRFQKAVYDGELTCENKRYPRVCLLRFPMDDTVELGFLHCSSAQCR